MPAHCYDPTLITKPKTFYIQSISALFDLMAPALAVGNLASFKRRNLKSFPPTKALGRYEDIICSFLWLGDNWRVWQVMFQRDPQSSQAV
jgi:hypothetical protein